jgi:hypothetical protein
MRSLMYVCGGTVHTGIQDERSRRKVVKLLMSLLSSINLKVLRLLVGFLALFIDTLPKNSRRHVINVRYIRTACTAPFPLVGCVCGTQLTPRFVVLRRLRGRL